MDKKTILGLVIIGVILFGYTFYTSKQTQKEQLFRAEQAQLRERERFVADSLDRVMNPDKYSVDPEKVRAAAEQLEQQQREGQLQAQAELISNIGESLVEAQKGEEQIYILENDVMKMYVSSRGAQVVNVELKDYKRYGGEPLMLFKDESARFNMEFHLQRNFRNITINSTDYLFMTDQSRDIVLVEGEASKSLSMRLPVDESTGSYIEYVYTLLPGEYMVDFQVNFINMREMAYNSRDMRFVWQVTTLQNEKGYKNENMYTTVAYRYPDVKKVTQLGMSEGSKGEEITTNLKWVSFKQQFFSSTFIADNNFSYAKFGYSPAPMQGRGEMKNFAADLSVPFTPDKTAYDFQFYFGPNKYSILKKYGQRLEKVIPLGGSLIGWVNTGFVIPVFNWLSKHIASFGIIILILTIMIKLIILPLTYKSYMSSAKMRVLKPEIEEINERYPKQEDAMKKQQATMALYKQSGVSPMGGCLPMLIQMPILIALFRFFPSSIELRGESFLWAEDLSAYDSILDLPFKIPLYGDHVSLFTLLMAVAMFFYSKINYQQTAGAGQQMAGMKFMTVYLMPIMMLCWFNSYASGLTYYYMLSQLFTIAIMTGFRYFVNEDKLRAKLQSNAAKSVSTPKKKSKFQQRYEEALRQQQQMQRQQQGGSASGRANTAKPQSTKNQPKKKRK